VLQEEEVETRKLESPGSRGQKQQKNQKTESRPRTGDRGPKASMNHPFLERKTGRQIGESWLKG